MKPNLISERSFKFAIEIVPLYVPLKKSGEYVISRQLLRSGTSIGANVSEASAAQSKKDFTSKMSIASKEARETLYWLRLLHEGQLVSFNLEYHMSQTIELINNLTAIVKTSTQRQGGKISFTNSTFNI